MDSRRQSHWGWQIATAVFLGGAGGGAFLISFIMDILGMYESITGIGAVAGPVLVTICAIFLFSHLGSKYNVYLLFGNIRTSWMSRGTWFIMLFVIFGLIYALPSFWIPWGTATTPGLVIGIIAAVLAFLVTFYTGILFGVLKRIPLWNTPALPLLYIFSALSTGMAILVLAAAFITESLGDVFIASVPAEISIIVMELIILGVYLEVIRKVSDTGAESVRLLLNPLFLIVVLGAGLVIPLVLLVYTEAVGHTLVISIVSTVLVLIGGFLLRYTILKSGVFLDWYSS